MLTTTIEQSKRLIDAGLNEITADFLFYMDGKPHMRPREFRRVGLPAWSMSALWDIIFSADVRYYDFSTAEDSAAVIETLVEAVIRLCKSGQI